MSVLIYLATIFWALFPNLIYVFQGGDNFINKVNATNLVVNGDFSNGTTGWSISGYSSYSISNGNIKVFANGTGYIPAIRKDINIIANNVYYAYYYINSNDTTNNKIIRFSPSPYTTIFDNAVIPTNYISNIFTPTANKSTIEIMLNGYTNHIPLITEYIEFGSFKLFNVSEMILKGVKDDNGILFSDLTDEEIKTQLDTWINEHGNLSYIITKDNTSDSWFDSGFVDKTVERDFLDYLGYFVWLLTPPIILFATLKLLRRVL